MIAADPGEIRNCETLFKKIDRPLVQF